MTKNVCNTLIGSAAGVFIGLTFAVLGSRIGLPLKSMLLSAIAISVIVGSVLSVIFYYLSPENMKDKDS